MCKGPVAGGNRGTKGMIEPGWSPKDAEESVWARG